MGTPLPTPDDSQDSVQLEVLPEELALFPEPLQKLPSQIKLRKYAFKDPIKYKIPKNFRKYCVKHHSVLCPVCNLTKLAIKNLTKSRHRVTDPPLRSTDPSLRRDDPSSTSPTRIESEDFNGRAQINPVSTYPPNSLVSFRKSVTCPSCGCCNCSRFPPITKTKFTQTVPFGTQNKAKATYLVAPLLNRDRRPPLLRFTPLVRPTVTNKHIPSLLELPLPPFSSQSTYPSF